MSMLSHMAILRGIPVRTSQGRSFTVDLSIRQSARRGWQVAGRSAVDFGIPEFTTSLRQLTHLPAIFFGVDWTPHAELTLLEPINLKTLQFFAQSY